MKNYCYLLYLLLLLSCTPKVQLLPAEGYRLVWADEFDRDGPPSPANWTSELGFVRNEEAQWFQPGNAYCEDGMLIIEARREQVRNPGYQAGSDNWRKNREFAEYTSSSITTQGLHQWQYGRFEMRARIDTRPGLWPAFWTLGVEGEWPGNGEIDIMEYYRGTLLANVAWGTAARWVAEWDAVKKPLTSFDDPQWSEKFHIWRMDWTPHSIRLFVDDLLMNETLLSDTLNGDGSDINPFRKPHYLLLTLAVGGSNGGNPSRTEFPARFIVDYIRVYEL